MDDDYHGLTSPIGRARQRQLARRRRRETRPMAIRHEATRKVRFNGSFLQKLDWIWNQNRHHPAIFKAIIILFSAIVLSLMAIFVFSNQVPPNVWILDIPLGGVPYQDAANQLQTMWDDSIQFNLILGERQWHIKPFDLGFRLDADKTIELTRGIGLAGIPFGYSFDPVFTFDESAARTFLLDFADNVVIPSTNARYAWQNDTLIGLLGTRGINVDIETTLAYLADTGTNIIHTRQVELAATPLLPSAADPMIWYNEAIDFVNTPFHLIGYDPFRNESISWTAAPEILATWIEADTTGLAVRSDTLSDFVQSINTNLNTTSNGATYINAQEAAEAVNAALRENQIAAQIRIHYQPGRYEVIPGDTAYRISRKTGVPFYLIEQENPDRDLNVLSPGDIIRLPSRDVTVPLPPVANKRIIVNLETQSLVAYENNQEVFRWPISSGIADAPTSPGIYQILNHVSVAYGSSYTLCDDLGCGQWEMNWFMGIYEVTYGLVNGFHGAVLLPNGAYLGGNNVGTPYTLGCVMSRDEQAKQLYDWAEDGTIVEIVSRDFPPQSTLARQGYG